MELFHTSLRILNARASTSFDWFTHAPPSGTAFSPNFLILTPQGQIGLVTAVVGLAIVFFCAGWVFGGRRRTDRV